MRRIARTTQPRTHKSSAFATFIALQFALGLAIAQVKLMGAVLGTCGNCGGNIEACDDCNGGRGPGQCSDRRCVNGKRCTGGCTNFSRRRGIF